LSEAAKPANRFVHIRGLLPTCFVSCRRFASVYNSLRLFYVPA
jgi:hypothetical protein